MSDMKNNEAVIKACDKGKKSLHGLFGICNFQRNFHLITHIKLYRNINIALSYDYCLAVSYGIS